MLKSLLIALFSVASSFVILGQDTLTTHPYALPTTSSLKLPEDAEVLAEFEDIKVFDVIIDGDYKMYLTSFRATDTLFIDLTEFSFGTCDSIWPESITGYNWLRVNEYGGRSGWSGGHSFHEQRMIIMDISQGIVYLDESVYLFSEMWGNILDDEEADEPEIIETYYEESCESYLMEKSHNSIYFSSDTVACPGTEAYFVEYLWDTELQYFKSISK